MISWPPSSTPLLQHYKENWVANNVCGAYNFLTFLCFCLGHTKMAFQYSPSSFDEAYSNKTSSNQDNIPSSTETLIRTPQSVQSLGSPQLLGTASYINAQTPPFFPAQPQNLLGANCFDLDLFRSHVEALPRTSLASESYPVPSPSQLEREESRIMRYIAHNSCRQPG